jgi:hypothetical protein
MLSTRRVAGMGRLALEFGATVPRRTYVRALKK